MVPLRVSAKSFERRYRERTKALQELAGRLHDRPLADEIHDLRVTTRRVQVMRKLLPKVVRSSQGSRKFGATLKHVLKVTSQLRDMDTLKETLEAHRDALPTEVIVTLENQRSDAAARAKSVTDILAKVPAPGLDYGLVKGKKVSRRLNRRVRKRGRAAVDLIAEVVNDESRVEELHSLRKEVKKLRYLLELADEGPSELSVLTSWQESLGAIHDLDVAIAHLQGSRIDSKGRAVSELQRSRHTKYSKFISQYRTDTLEALDSSDILAGSPILPPY